MRTRQWIVSILVIGITAGSALAGRLTLKYSTYLGGANGDYAYGVSVDSTGSIYVAGSTLSGDFPTNNMYQPAHAAAGVTYDAFVTKFAPDGQTLLYSTYIGGTGSENTYGLVLDTNGSAIICGYTGSTNFPTNNAYQANQSADDIFVTKLAPDGQSLVFSTYLGGSGLDQIAACSGSLAIDSTGSVYVAGVSRSANFPVTAGALQAAHANTAFYDTTITKFAPDGQSLIYSTYLGGTGVDYGRGVSVDTSGCAYAVGYTTSSDFPTSNALDSALSGVEDVFVTKFAPEGTSLVYSTYIGGSDADYGYGIDVDDQGCAYVIGWTTSTNWPATAGAYSTNLADAGASDCFVAKLSTNGAALIYSTYLGGYDEDVPYGLDIDSSGAACVVGYTRSSAVTVFPTTNAYLGTWPGGTQNGFMSRISPDGSNLVASTFLGGNDTDLAFDIALDGSNRMHIVGYTRSTNFPVVSAYQAANSGDQDAFVTILVYDRSGLTMFGTNGTSVVSGAATSVAAGTDFGSIGTWASWTNTFSVTNTGPLELTISDVTTNGAGASSYEVVSLPSSAGVAGPVQTFSVIFSPQADGALPAALNIINNSPTNVFVMNLAGLGELPSGGIGLETNLLSFAATYGGVNPAAQTLQMTNFGGSIFSYTNTQAYGDAGGWLTVTQTNGSLLISDSITVTNAVDITGLNAGTYYGTNIVVSDDATNAPQHYVSVLAIGKAAQEITFGNPGAQLTTNTVVLGAAATSGLPVSFAVDSGPGSIAAGSNLTFTGTGTVGIVASQSGGSNYNAAVSVTNTFAVTKATATVMLFDLAQIYDGTGRVVTNTTVPGGLTLDTTYDGGVVIPTNTGSYAVTGTVNDVMYQGAETGTLIVSKGNQTITFGNPGAQLTTNTVVLGAAVSSGRPVTFVVDSGPGSIAGGSNLTFTATGMVSIAASQGGDGNYNAAVGVTNTFAVTKATATVILFDLAQIYDGTGRVVTNTTVPGGLTVGITYGGGIVVPTNAGNYAAVATISDIMYQGVGTGMLVVARADQAIAFGNPGAQLTTNTVVLSATAASGLPVLFAVGSGSASIADGSNVTFTGAGAVSIVGSQGGDANYTAAPSVTNTFTVTKATGTVTLFDFAQTYDAAGHAVTNITVPAGMTVDTTYNSMPALPTNAGSYAVTGTVDDVMYQGVGTGTLVVARADHTITFGNPGAQLTTNTVVLSATASSGLPVSFAVDSGPGWIAASSNLTFTETGMVSIAASQGGDGNYNAAVSATNTFAVTKATAMVMLFDFAQTYDGTGRVVTNFTIPGELLVDTTYDGGMVIPTNAGSYAVTGMVDDVLFQGLGTGTLVVARVDQSIQFMNPGPQLVTDTFGLAATGGASTNPVTFAVVLGPAVITGGTNLSFTGAGTVRVRASQVGDANYNAAPSRTRTFAVSALPPIVGAPTSSNILASTADLGSEVTVSNGVPIAERGICWSVTNGFANGEGTLVSETGSFGTGTFSIAVTGLAPGRSNYFKAYAGNIAGTNYTVQAGFLTRPDAPGAIAATNPLESSVFANWMPAFGATNYLFDASDTNDFSSYLPGFSNLSVGLVETIEITGLTPGSPYYYRLRAENAAGVSTNSDSMTAAAALPWPARDAVIAIRRPSFSWDPVADATWYYLWINRNGTVFHKLWVQGTASWTPDFDMKGGDYAWWIRPWNLATGYGEWSTLAAFSIPVNVPGKAALIGPVDNIGTNRPEFVWQAVADSAWYQIWLERDKTLVQKAWIADATNYTAAAGLTYGNYTWWIQTWNADGVGPWSDLMKFDIGRPVPVAPAGVQGAAPTELRWNDTSSHNAVSYYLWIGADGAEYWSKLVLQGDTGNAGGGERTYALPVVAPAGSYQWWIRAYGPSAAGRWSVGSPFTVP